MAGPLNALIKAISQPTLVHPNSNVNAADNPHRKVSKAKAKSMATAQFSAATCTAVATRAR